MTTFIDRLFNSSDFMPHGHCYLWRPEILWLHVISDGLIALAYYSIPLALVYLVRKRRDLPFAWLFWLFGIFIIACGTTHILAIVTVWSPIYRLDGVVKAITAIASVLTALVLIPIIPKALGLASPAQLMAANALLEQEITARKEAQEQLASVNREMEARVDMRTRELGASLEQLRRSEERLYTVLNAAPVILFATDLTGRYIFSEGKGLEIVEMKPGERVGSSILDMYRDRPDILDCYQRALGGAAAQIEAPIGDRTMDLRCSPTRGEDGAVNGVSGIVVDITASSLARDALKKAKDEAERANSAKSEFLSRMSHELRTPLNAVLGFAQLLEMGAVSSDDAAMVQQILKAGRHLLALIDEVLDISRIEAGRLDLTIESLNAREMVEAALKLIEPLARPRHLRLEIAPDFPAVHVLADKLRFHQSLLNLLSNAAKFNREGGSVRVSGERHGTRVRVVVSDTGLGIGEADIGKLFTPFERLDANERNINGTGIGLALSKRLMESQGGEIGVESRLGEGSSFWIDLPYTDAPAEGAVERNRTLASDDVSSEPRRASTVLYIEDNLSNYTLVESILKRYSHVQLIAAMQGVLGLEMAREHKPDLILLDLQLPDIRGDEVLRQLQADPATRNIPVVMLSADAMPPQVERLLAAGAREYLTKPLDVRRFLNAINEFLQIEQTPQN